MIEWAGNSCIEILGFRVLGLMPVPLHRTFFLLSEVY